jgi:hypothetical protein
MRILDHVKGVWIETIVYRYHLFKINPSKLHDVFFDNIGNCDDGMREGALGVAAGGVLGVVARMASEWLLTDFLQYSARFHTELWYTLYYSSAL